MEILLLGANHRSAPVGIRERLVFDPTTLQDVLSRLTGPPEIREGFLLSTCNRTETLVVADSRDTGFPALRSFLGKEKDFRINEMEQYCYGYRGEEAVRHLFRVASSLDSQVLGETQILGQVKEAFSRAQEAGTIGPVLDRLLRKALVVAKRVKTDTGIHRNPVSISSSAAQLARQIFGDLREKSIMVVGSGKMSELGARHLIGKGVRMVFVANRTYDRALELARKHSGIAIRFDRLPEYLEKVDVVLTSTSAPHPILRKEDVQALMRRRRGRPIFFIDIAVPRDIEPSVNEIDNVYLYDIDDLQTVVDSNREFRENEAVGAQRIVDREVTGFSQWLLSQDLNPTIVAFRERLHAIRQSELRRFRKKLGPLSRQQEEAIGEMTVSMVNKILHSPIQWLKRSAGGPDALKLAALVKNLFGHSKDSDTDVSERKTEN